jgi:hypothetical protein
MIVQRANSGLIIVQRLHFQGERLEPLRNLEV